MKLPPSSTSELDQRMPGHASAALTLDTYGHLMPGQAEAVANKLDAIARNAPRTCAAVVSIGSRDSRGMVEQADAVDAARLLA